MKKLTGKTNMMMMMEMCMWTDNMCMLSRASFSKGISILKAKS